MRLMCLMWWERQHKPVWGSDSSARVRILPMGLSQERFPVTGRSLARPMGNSSGGSEGHTGQGVKDHSEGMLVLALDSSVKGTDERDKHGQGLNPGN